MAHIIVVGNEKGGAGKSTLVIHIATGLMHAGARVAVMDLDVRQQSTAHFFANRRKWRDSWESVVYCSERCRRAKTPRPPGS